jgi:hypothetical protein
MVTASMPDETTEMITIYQIFSPFTRQYLKTIPVAVAFGEPAIS